MALADRCLPEMHRPRHVDRPDDALLRRMLTAAGVGHKATYLPREVATVIGVHVNTAYTLIQSGVIEGIRNPGRGDGQRHHLRVPYDSLAEYLNTHSTRSGD